jgi:hypothetical protein
VVFLSFTFRYQQCNASTAAAQHQYRHALAHLQVHHWSSAVSTHRDCLEAKDIRRAKIAFAI